MAIMEAQFRLKTVRRQLPWSCLVTMPSIGICSVWMPSLPPVASQSLPPAVMSPDVHYLGFASQSLPPLSSLPTYITQSLSPSDVPLLTVAPYTLLSVILLTPSTLPSPLPSLRPHWAAFSPALPPLSYASTLHLAVSPAL